MTDTANDLSTKRKPTAVVVGTGFIGPVHVEALGRTGVDVIGILGSTPQKSIAAAKSLGLARGYASLDEVLADDSVDSVHLTTPNRFHFEQATAVIKAGKHVMCEKPLAMNSEQSQQLVELAERSGVVAGVAYNIRFYPLCHEAAARVSAPDFGDVLHITGSYVQDWLLKETDFNWRVMADVGGALRAVADIGTHWLDLVQFISGNKIVAVCADLQTVHATRQRQVGGSLTFSDDASGETEPVSIDTEDAGSILLRFADGSRGCLHVSQVTAGRKNCLRYEIAGSKQALSWNSEQPNSLWIGHRDRPGEQLVRDPAMMHPSAGGIANYPGGHCEGFPDTFKQLFKSFYGYIDAGDLSAPRPFPTFADGHREVLLCEAILDSHRQQTWVSCGC
ncbi:1,5-anhydro-D-fructose reductase [Rubripirellula tenax]|uniref:1,5-anhydro-D-fructose reductase n=1 Tax=Rubripirellula tenax TaxID=2528015 RepID=A0A5C6EJI3_9BACT|nr:Gfo/Idh/MocA family oxidoreductase [Rubripirellula tenax]TWU48694.1 1,5-anhydro-D-fructose reductase [Rubripirellula tenax]